MWHPLAPDITGLKDEEIYEKINELSRKMNAASRVGSMEAVSQMQMIMSHYQTELQNRNRKKMEELQAKNPQFKNIIDIK